MEKKNKAVVYQMVRPYVIGTTEDWKEDETSLSQLNRTFNGAVDVIALRIADGTHVGIDAWVLDDALGQPRVGAYQIAFGDEYYGVAFLPQTGTGMVVLGVNEQGETFGLTDKQALEVQQNLSITLIKELNND